MKERYLWVWPGSEHGAATGINSSKIGEFKRDKYGNLGRESIQNALDARRDFSAPVIVEYSIFERPGRDIPDSEGLEQYFDQWLKYARSGSTKHVNSGDHEAAKEGLDAIRDSHSSWLRISDHNTKGMPGATTLENQLDTPFFGFVKGLGIHVNESDESGGSKGVGKDALFANSHIRTIFVSTQPADGSPVGFMGVAKLSSIPKPKGVGELVADTTQGIGYCVPSTVICQKYKLPGNEVANFDPSMSPRVFEDKGTDIYIPCFDRDDDFWIQRLSAEIIISFMPAFLNRDLVVKIKDEADEWVTIDNETIGSLIEESNLFAHDEGKQRVAKALFETLTSEQTVRKTMDLGGDTEVEFLFFKGGAFPTNQVFCYRYPLKMRIQKLRIHSNSSLPYTAIMLIKGKKICSLLKLGENDSHSNWSKNAAPSSKKEEVQKAIDTIKNFASDCIKENSGLRLDDASDMEWASENGFASKEESDNGKTKDSGLFTEEIYFDQPKVTTKSRKKRKPLTNKSVVPDEGEQPEAESFLESTGFKDEEGSEIGTVPTGPAMVNPNPPHPHPGDSIPASEGGDKLMLLRKPVQIINARIRSISPAKMTVTFRSPKSGVDFRLSMRKLGYSGETEKTCILKAEMGSQVLPVDGTFIYMGNVERNKEYIIEVETNERLNFIWEVTADAEEI